MARGATHDGRAGIRPTVEAGSGVGTELAGAERQLAAVRREYERERRELLALRDEAQQLRTRVAHLHDDLADARREAARFAGLARSHAGQLAEERERADRLVAQVRAIHDALLADRPDGPLDDGNLQHLLHALHAALLEEVDADDAPTQGTPPVS